MTRILCLILFFALFSKGVFAQVSAETCEGLSFQIDSGYAEIRGKKRELVQPQLFKLDCTSTNVDVAFKWTNEWTSVKIRFAVTRTRNGVVYVDSESGTRFTMPRMNTAVCGMLTDDHIAVHACLLPVSSNL